MPQQIKQHKKGVTAANQDWTARLGRKRHLVQSVLGSLCAWLIAGLSTGLSGCAIDPVVLTGEQVVVQQPAGNKAVGPVIVLEAGAGDGPAKWADLQQTLAQQAVVVSYDRPRRGSQPMTGVEVARNLRQQLQSRGLQPPYLLVGHSLGGPYVLSFAMQYPDEIAALVLIDGRPKGFAQACQAAGGRLCDIPAWLHPTLPDWVSAEVKGLPATYLQHGDYQSMPDVPVLVLCADNPPPLSDEIFMRAWRLQQQRQASWFKQGRYLLVKDASHYIHHDEPALVAREILALWRQAGVVQPTH